MLAKLLAKVLVFSSISFGAEGLALIAAVFLVILLAHPAGRAALRRDGPRLLRHAIAIVIGFAVLGAVLATFAA